jgi:DNA mismatch repair protein MutS
LRSIDELPLFALAPKPAARKDELREKLASIDPDDLSPRDAQAALYVLKKLAMEKTA